MITHQQWLTIREAALALGVSELTVRRRIKDGKMVSRSEGGKYYVLLGAESLDERDELDGDGPSTDGAASSRHDQPDAASSPTTVPAVDLDGLLREQARLAEIAGRAGLLEEHVRALDERNRSLQDGLVALSSRNGWLESKLEEREREVKLLTDSGHRPWWRRMFGGGS